jgi:hypothetical protein
MQIAIGVAGNPCTPRDLLAVLVEDVNPDVQKAALQRFAPPGD